MPAAPLADAPAVLSYEKPFLYRYRSDLPPPGPVAKAFWWGCFAAGRVFGRFYRPRPAPRLYTSGR